MIPLSSNAFANMYMLPGEYSQWDEMAVKFEFKIGMVDVLNVCVCDCESVYEYYIVIKCPYCDREPTFIRWVIQNMFRYDA